MKQQIFVSSQKTICENTHIPKKYFDWLTNIVELVTSEYSAFIFIKVHNTKSPIRKAIDKLRETYIWIDF